VQQPLAAEERDPPRVRPRDIVAKPRGVRGAERRGRADLLGGGVGMPSADRPAHEPEGLVAEETEAPSARRRRALPARLGERAHPAGDGPPPPPVPAAGARAAAPP